MKARFHFALFLIAGLIICPRVWSDDAIQPPLPDSGEVIRKIIERASLNLTNQYRAAVTFYRTNITEDYNSRGNVKDRTATVKKVVLREGERTTTLILYNGQPPTEKEVEREQKKKDRRRSGQDDKDGPDRSKQISNYITTEILGRFLFEVLGREIIEGRSCLIVSFIPGTNQETTSKIFDRVINQMGGIIWVDEEEFEMVKADIQLRKRVKMWGGLLAALDRISLKIHRMRGDDGFWIDHTVEARFAGRALTKRIDVMTWDFTSKPIYPKQPPDKGDVVAAQ